MLGLLAAGAASLPLATLRPRVAAATPVPSPGFDAIVSRRAIADADAPVFANLQALLASDLAQGERPLAVRMASGEHWGQTVIRRPNVRLFGDGVDRSFVRAGAYAGAIAPDGKPYGTFGSAVLDVQAPGFEACDLTIENAFDAWQEMHKPNGLKADLGGSQQALALSLSRDADRSMITRCNISSHQDTLYCEKGRALFDQCRIRGSYDFIFGGASARFERCEIVSRPRIEPVEGYIAAPNTLLSRPAGLVFDGCTLVAEPGVPEGSVFLGRPWKTADDAIGMAAFLNCAMGPHIAPMGWTNMWYGNFSPPRYIEPEAARFFEYANHGPGAAGKRRATMLDAEGAAQLSRQAMFGDWSPAA